MATFRGLHHPFSPNSASPLFGDFVLALNAISNAECNSREHKEKRPREMLIREDALYNIRVI